MWLEPSRTPCPFARSLSSPAGFRSRQDSSWRFGPVSVVAVSVDSKPVAGRADVLVEGRLVTVRLAQE